MSVCISFLVPGVLESSVEILASGVTELPSSGSTSGSASGDTVTSWLGIHCVTKGAGGFVFSLTLDRVGVGDGDGSDTIETVGGSLTGAELGSGVTGATVGGSDTRTGEDVGGSLTSDKSFVGGSLTEIARVSPVPT